MRVGAGVGICAGAVVGAGVRVGTGAAIVGCCVSVMAACCCVHAASSVTTEQRRRLEHHCTVVLPGSGSAIFSHLHEGEDSEGFMDVFEADEAEVIAVIVDGGDAHVG